MEREVAGSVVGWLNAEPEEEPETAGLEEVTVNAEVPVTEVWTDELGFEEDGDALAASAGCEPTSAKGEVTERCWSGDVEKETAKAKSLEVVVEITSLVATADTGSRLKTPASPSEGVGKAGVS